MYMLNWIFAGYTDCILGFVVRTQARLHVHTRIND